MRRELELKNLIEAVEECRALYESGYEATGKWSLGQMCNHIRLTIESNMSGYPKWMTILGYPLRPVLRRFALPRLIAGRSINGVRTAGMYVPSSGLEDAIELDKFEQCVEQFLNSTGALHPHPGFGKMSREEFNCFHAAHAAHHLSFLHRLDNQSAA